MGNERNQKIMNITKILEDKKKSMKQYENQFTEWKIVYSY